MSWNQSVVTNAGVGLLNESLAGHTLTIESAVGGAGTLTEEELAAATDVADQKQTFALLGIEDIEGGKRVGIQITNNGVSESYILHQIGVQARLEYEEAPLTLLIILQDEHGVEIPTEAENPDWLFEIYAVISISNKANITVNIDTSAIASVSYVQRTFVPMTRKINGKVLSGDVTLSGDDIKTSAEDDTPVSAALSNKAPAGYGLGTPASPISDGDILEVMRRLKTGWYAGTNVANAPTTVSGGVGWYTFDVVAMGPGPEIYSVCIATHVYGGERYLGYIYNDIWSGWVPLPAQILPKVYPLPMAEGVTSTGLTYWKDGMNNVALSGTFSFHSAPGPSQMIGTLPEGYRPTEAKNICVQSATGSATYGWVGTDGSVYLSGSDHSGQFSSGESLAVISVPFYAAN